MAQKNEKGEVKGEVKGDRRNRLEAIRILGRRNKICYLKGTKKN